MNIQASEQRARRRPIAAGLLVMLAGPLLGLCPILAWFALGLGEFSLGYLTVRSVIFGAYCLGGIQSAIAGLLVAAAIYRHDWISIRHWAAITAILALPPILLLVMTGMCPEGRV